MEAIHLRDYLINALSNENDISILEALVNLLETKKIEKKYILSNIEQEMLKSRIEDIKNGEFIENEQFFIEMEEWLCEK